MNTELTIGAINPGYGGLPIGVAAALGGATLAWHAHPYRVHEHAGNAVMLYHHPRAAAYASFDVPPPMVDVLTINGFTDWCVAAAVLIDAGYKPPLIVVEVRYPRDEARPICARLARAGYRANWGLVRACDVGAPHVRPRVYVTAVRKDCDVPTVNAAYLDADRAFSPLWPTPAVGDMLLGGTACQWVRDDLAGHPDKALTGSLDHWAKVIGEPYPYPLYTAPTPETEGSPSLAFMEWLMGLPIGYMSTPTLPLTHAERMHLLQAGTVPLQAAHALALALAS